MTAQKVSLEKVTASLSLPLFSGVKSTVKKGETVKEGQVMAQKKGSPQTKKYHLDKLLGVSSPKVIKFLVKEIGASVKEGEIIAQKKGLWGKKEEFVAPIDGVLASLSEEGVLEISQEIEEKKIEAPFAGRVKEVTAHSITLVFASTEIKGSWGAGNKATGYLTVLQEEKEDLLALDGTACREQILGFQGELSRGWWYKALSLGAKGFLAGGLKERSLIKEIEEEEEMIPVVILGLGGKIEPGIWAELKKAQGKKILIDGQEKRILIPG
ncbi:MAG: hypothetical protein MUP45_02095 [Candidatus Marinimicrobia bacterium]|nr:hypothetical protein [Candidatus Neomarinimicrobiota bacterium]